MNKNQESSANSIWSMVFGLGLIFGAGATIIYVSKLEEKKKRY